MSLYLIKPMGLFFFKVNNLQTLFLVRKIWGRVRAEVNPGIYKLLKQYTDCDMSAETLILLARETNNIDIGRNNSAEKSG